MSSQVVSSEGHRLVEEGGGYYREFCQVAQLVSWLG